MCLDTLGKIAKTQQSPGLDSPYHPPAPFNHEYGDCYNRFIIPVCLVFASFLGWTDPAASHPSDLSSKRGCAPVEWKLATTQRRLPMPCWFWQGRGTWSHYETRAGAGSGSCSAWMGSIGCTASVGQDYATPCVPFMGTEIFPLSGRVWQ